jgi:outer membrane receptor protein involved in Fe transport
MAGRTSPGRRRAAALALLPWSLAQAQQQEAPAVASVEIVGAAPLKGPGVDRATLPYQVQMLDRAQLAEARGATLAEVMARTLGGVNINDVSGSPYQPDLSYRGFRASPVLGTAQGLSVYLDGVRVNEPFGDIVNWDLLPEAAIDTVLLAPGSNPAYGLNTIGGALAMTSKSGRAQPGLQVEASTSLGGRRRADLAWGASDSELRHAFIAASVADDRGWRDHSPARIGKLFAKAGRQGGATSWDLSLLAAASRLQGNGLLPSYRWEEGGLRNGLFEENPRAAYTVPDLNRNRLVQGTLNVVRRLAGRTQLSLLAYLRSSRRDSVGGDVSEAYADFVDDCGSAPCSMDDAPHEAVLNTTATRQRSGGVAAQFSRATRTHQLRLGATFDRSRVQYAQFEQDATFTAGRIVAALPDAAREPGPAVSGGTSVLGLYLADIWQIAPSTHLSYSARWNRAVVGNTLTNGSGVSAHELFTYTRLNPALGLAHRLDGDATLFLNLAQGNRVPTVIELGCADPLQPCRLPVGLQSDPYLRQVVARTAEAGLRWPGRDGSLAVSAYRTQSDDDILFFTAGQTHQGYFANFRRTLHQGVELSAQHGSGPFSVQLNYNFLDATYDAPGELFAGVRRVRVERGTRIAGLPRHTLKLGVQWKLADRLTAGADLLALSSLVTQGNEDGQRDDDGNLADWRVSGYALASVHASYRTRGKWEWYARVDNLFDRRHASFGAVAPDMFPGGRLVSAAPSTARFVAPGAPRTVSAGLRRGF